MAPSALADQAEAGPLKGRPSLRGGPAIALALAAGASPRLAKPRHVVHDVLTTPGKPVGLQADGRREAAFPGVAQDGARLQLDHRCHFRFVEQFAVDGFLGWARHGTPTSCYHALDGSASDWDRSLGHV